MSEPKMEKNRKILLYATINNAHRMKAREAHQFIRYKFRYPIPLYTQKNR